MKRWALILAALLMLPALANASLEKTVSTMLANNQYMGMVNDNELGRTVIAIGLGMHRKANVAQEIARQDAMKSLTAYLKGERISSVERASQSWKGDTVLEEYYTSLTSNVEGTLKAAWNFNTGEHDGMTYNVMVISERSGDFSELFEEQDSIVEARGVASLSSGVEAARTTALNNALRSAVEQYGGVQMASKTTVENAEALRAKLSTVSSGHVQRYTVIKEYQEGNNYFIIISAEVSDSPPDGQQQILAIQENMGRPSFAIQTDRPEVDRLMRELLATSGFEVSSSPNSARYTIKTDISKYEYKAMGGMTGLQTTIKVRITDRFSSDDLINVSSDPNNSVEISDSATIREQNSLSYAMEDLQPKLTSAIKKQFISQFNNGSKIQVTLKNFDRMRDVDELRACLESLPLTKSVSVQPIQNRSANYEVIYLGDPASLQLDILKQSRSFSLRGLKAKNTDTRAVVLSF